ncbi:MAG: UDP-3-O-(3-hydroxymyristoyl)glucosamine N-acyltransferase [Candidatus Latescibacteria bacterium]|nr:UDP-3-O-(3-hydroxymyristoyl)glucosamine N-acyltransferase [Candidatus Latescibacterota bacterium]
MSFTLEHICHVIGCEIPRQAENIVIKGLSSIEEARPEDICFLSNPKYLKHLNTTNAQVVLVGKGTPVPDNILPIEVENPYFTFVKLLALFNTRKSTDIASGIHPNAVIDPDAKIGNNVSVGPFAVIQSDVIIGDNTVLGPCSVILTKSSIGKDCIIYPNVTIMDRCIIGNSVILQAGAVIGSDGFGFAPHKGRYHKIPQIGIVRIEDEVEIGAGTCVDRAVFGETVIKRGTKLDNLIQVAHNVQIGSDTVIASQAGISGSTKIGNNVKLGGQAGISGHLTINDGASVGAQAGVTKDVAENETVSGYPAKIHMKAMRLEAALRNLPELIKKVKAQEKRILELERIIKERS